MTSLKPGIWSSLPWELVYDMTEIAEGSSRWRMAHICRRWRHAALKVLGGEVTTCLEIFHAISPLNKSRSVSISSIISIWPLNTR